MVDRLTRACKLSLRARKRIRNGKWVDALILLRYAITLRGDKNARTRNIYSKRVVRKRESEEVE